MGFVEQSIYDEMKETNDGDQLQNEVENNINENSAGSEDKNVPHFDDDVAVTMTLI